MSTQASHDVLTDLLHLAVRLAGATSGELEVRVGSETRVLRTGAGESRGADYSVAVSDDAGGRLGELRMHTAPGSAPDSQTQDDLASLARAVAACAAAEVSEARAFDAAEAAAGAEEQLARVADQVAHDLNNPLAALAMSLEIAQDHVEESQTLLSGLLDRAAGSAARMKRMTADLLSYGHRPAAGTTDLEVELDSVLEALDGLIPGEVVRERPLPVVPGQPGDHRTVLVGILENAVKFASDGEPVHLTVDAEPGAGECRITFSDRGRGVPAEEAERILDPTVRLDKRVPGLGLGLSSARRIITAHGGSIGVEPRPGGGTVTWIVLPEVDADRA